MSNIELQRRIDRYAGQLICFFLSLFYKKKKAVATSAPRKILVILLSEMGSLVLAQPMFQEIKKRHSQAEIHVLLFEQNREVIEMLNVVSSVKLHSLSNKSLPKLIVDSIKVLRKLRKDKIDTVIDCELFARISSIFSVLSGAQLRAGFYPYNQEGLYRGNFINCPVMYNPYLHISQQFLSLLDAIESNDFPSSKRLIEGKLPSIPSMEILEREKEEMRLRLKELCPGFQGKQLVLIYASGGLLPIRAWPLDSFCELAQELTSRGNAVGVIGLSEAKYTADAIIKACPKGLAVDLVGFTKTVREVVVLMHFGDLLITNDGGPGHFASLTSIPALIFFGPETSLLYGSLSPNAIHMQSNIACSPCLTAYNHRNSACDGNNICLKSITVLEVLEKSLQILQKKY